MTTNEAWFDRALVAIPGGVDSPVRSFASVGGRPFTVASGSGATLTDVEGRRYLDYVQSYGASLLGHADPRVVAAITRAALKGSTFGAPTPGEVLLAERLCELVRGLEQVRFVSSGTEAVMSAIRVARGFTGRDRLVKFDGCYHGHSDAVLVAGGSGVAQLGLPGSAGVPDGAVADTLVVPYNVVPQLDDTVAAVIVEPFAANMNLVLPEAGFLEGLRAECDRVGALLIFDEVISGFRLHLGGAQAVTAVTPDLWTFGKVIGGGLPIGAFGGRRDVLACLAPNGPVYQAGTLSGNPLATAAGLTVLDNVSAETLAELSARVATFGAGLEGALRAGGLGATVISAGPLLGIYVAQENPTAPSNYDEAKAICANGYYPKLFHAMLERGIALAPGAYEVLFPSFAHTDQDFAATLDAAFSAAQAVVAGQ